MRPRRAPRHDQFELGPAESFPTKPRVLAIGQVPQIQTVRGGLDYPVVKVIFSTRRRFRAGSSTGQVAVSLRYVGDRNE